MNGANGTSVWFLTPPSKFISCDHQDGWHGLPFEKKCLESA